MLRAYFIIALLFSALVGTVLFGIVHATVSVPEFTVKAVTHPYDVPTTYSTDPYTGETITHEGYHVENKSIEVWIRNQPFTPYTDADGHEINLYYNVRVKGHFEPDWGTPQTYSESDSAKRVPPSNSEYTVLTLVNYYSSNAKVDYQVEAVTGYSHLVSDGHSFPIGTKFEIIEESGWSDTQTLTFSESQTPTPSPETTPSPLPSPYEIPIIGVAFIVIVFAAGLGLLIYIIKRK